MNPIVFTGPTLSPAEAGQVLDAVCLPPAAQGDVYRAALRRPPAIGIIDGFFESLPSVWHKEILWAMSQGIHVFGSASMGALRAAELAAFGMIGVGRIFEAYRAGVLEDDDEVAVVHGPAGSGYRAGSDAMVNIRATLAKAQTDGVLTAPAAAALRLLAKDLFYAERSYALLLDLGPAHGVAASELDDFRRWLPDGAVNEKREDALAMLQAMRELLRTGPAPKQVSYTFEETVFWEELVRGSHDTEVQTPDRIVLDELRSDPDALRRAEAAALGWMLAAAQARRDGHIPKAEDLLQESGEFSRAHGLTETGEVGRWLEWNQCSREHLERLLAGRSSAARAQLVAPGALEACLLDYLRWTGDYRMLLERARAR